MKYFLPLNEQIKLLNKRGLIIDDVEYAKDTLIRYNFYKLINSTFKYFTIDGNKEKYISGINFNHLVDAYKFEKEIKEKLLASCLEVERILRSLISYTFMYENPAPNSYLDLKNYGNRNEAKSIISSLESSLRRFENEINYHKSVKYYQDKYGSVPLWFLINFISFGKLIDFYENLKMKDQYKIADYFEKLVFENTHVPFDKHLSPRILTSYLEKIRVLRNLCAHDNLIFDYNFEFQSIYFAPIHGDWFELSDPRDKLFDTLLILQALLPRDKFNSIDQSILKRILRLKGNIPPYSFNKIMKSLGFPKDFKGVLK